MKKNNTIEIIIDDAVIDEIEMLGYEYESRKSVVAEMLSSNMNTNTDSFKKYEREMLEFKIQFEQAKKEIEKIYVNPVENGSHWNLDYESKTLTIYLKD